MPQVQSVFVVLAPGDETFAGQDWSAFEGRLEPLYCGGESRRDSVYNGLVAVGPQGGWSTADPADGAIKPAPLQGPAGVPVSLPARKAIILVGPAGK